MSAVEGNKSLLCSNGDQCAPRTWLELERYVAAAAQAAGEDPVKALRDLGRKGPLTRLLCRQLGIEVPRAKPGPKPKIGRDAILSQMERYARHELGLKGQALWEYVHREVATDGSVFGINQSATASAVERHNQRLKKSAKDRQIP